jgi:hypothetical protein
MSAWCPIDTAPRDGSEFLGWSAEHGYIVCNWPAGYGIGNWHIVGSEWRVGSDWRGISTSDALEATHWTKLPESPR